MAPREVVVVDVGDVTTLARLLAEVRGRGGWVNVRPEVAEDVAVPPTPTPMAVFSKRGPAVPLATWTPEVAGRRAEPATVGVQHGVGSALRDRLVGTAAQLPEGWRVVGDHPRRGLVVQVPAGVADEVVAAWLLEVVDLASVVPHTGRVEVLVYG